MRLFIAYLVWQVVFCGAVGLALSSCSTPRDYKQLSDQVAEYGLQVYDDAKHGNTCYMYRDGDYSALSCVKK